MNDTVQTLVIVIPVLLASMSIHEMMHALTSFWLGDDTAQSQGRISLNPLVHIDPITTLALPVFLALAGAPIFAAARPVQVNFARVKWGEFGGAIIGVVGPLTNFVLALLGAGILHIINPDPFGITAEVLAYFVAINIGLGVFNMIPWPPLDGSRLLYAFAPRPLQEIMESIEQMGITGLFIFIFLFYQFIGPSIGSLVQQLTNGLLG